MKTFKDITFKPIPRSVPGHYQSQTDLGNGLTLSVVYGGGTYSDVNKDGKPMTYEAALFFGNDFVPLSTCDDVIGWRSESEIDSLLHEIQSDEEFVKNRVDAKEAYDKELYG
jgi:hypothetical protein